MPSRIVNALSIDVEEFYHATVFQEAFRGPTTGLRSRVEPMTERVLGMLGARSVRATFFVLGEVAARHPGLVRRIAREGHEIACHDYHHTLVSSRTPEVFRADVRRAKALLEDLSGQAVMGYRAPTFSIGRAQGWAYGILAEEGFRYDSSVYPILHDRYGDRAAPRSPHEIGRGDGQRLIEFPIATVRRLGLNLPLGGGGYFRLLPGRLFELGIRHVNRVEGKPVMFYFHPWELDQDQPRYPMPWHRRFRLFVGQRGHPRKLARLLAHAPFAPAREVLEGVVVDALPSATMAS